LVFSKAEGARIQDIDGNEYIDYHMGFGPVILGHRDPDVENAVDEVRGSLDLIGAGSTEIEGKLCDKISKNVPSAEKVLLCTSGSEATYHAVRLSRAITKRKRIIKFQGCYHGWHDYLAMNVMSSRQKLGVHDPLSAGMLEEAMQYTTVLKFNSTQEVERCVAKNRGKVACIILEPIAHNIGCVPASLEFLKSLREICDREGIVLAFDEVITCFRHALGGYQSICGVTPDLTTFGKAVANGYPMAGICGRAEMMDRFNTAKGDVFFAGTFNAHPYSCAAALATIRKLEGSQIYDRLYKFGKVVSEGIDSEASKIGIETYTAHFGSVFITYFARPPMNSYDDVLRNDAQAFLSYRKAMIERGIFMLPYNGKRNYISAAHTDQDIERTVEKSGEALQLLSASREPS